MIAHFLQAICVNTNYADMKFSLSNYRPQLHVLVYTFVLN